MLDPWFARTYPLKHLKKWLYWPWAEYRILRDASLVLFTTQEEMTLARQSFWLYKAREKLVGYGISGRASGSTSQQNEFFKAFPALRNKRNILFLSRIHPKKGCDLLINAFIKVSSSDPDLNLIIAGPDQVGWQEKLSKIAQNAGVGDRVIFTGILSGALKWGAFDASEVFILPSHQENFGIVLAEALASSLPVLTTYNVNIWREIQHGKAGLIGTDTQEGVDDLLVRWCTMDVKEREEIKRNTLVCFNRNFEISNVTQNLLTALQSVIGK
jgi:glycosyltransferase involved in cell wall biosynthesis